MRRRRLRLENFSKGMVRDSGLDPERLMSLRTLKNYYIDYSDSRLKIRKGYTRWNTTALPSAATQLYHFVDLSQNEYLLGIAEDQSDSTYKWYLFDETGAHTNIRDEIATARRPVVSFGNRCIFATDAELYWTDQNLLDGGAARYNYGLGIVVPTNAPAITLTAGEGNNGAGLDPTAAQVAAGAGMVLNTDTQKKFAAAFTSGSDQDIQSISMRFMPVWAVPDTGGIRVVVYTGAGEPTTVLTNGTSDWSDITEYTTNTYNWYRFHFPEKMSLSSGTTYWIVVESDADYLANYNATAFYVTFSYTTGAVAGTSLRYESTWENESNAFMMRFVVGGLTPFDNYDYKTTYYNDTYKSESRPSPRSVRVRAVPSTNRVTVGTEATLDGQVDYSAIYRRNIGSDASVEEGLITAEYLYLDRVTPGNSFIDTIGPGDEGAQLQSDDHYLYDEFGDEGEGVRTSALVPEVMAVWKGRVWLAEANFNILYFSKKMEVDGSMGIVGDSIPDYFPLENQLEIRASSDIIALIPLSADELAIYFRNTSVWVLRGCDDVLNPPPDIVLRQMVTDVGLIAPAAVDSLRSRHIFLTRKGLYDFKGTVSQEYLSGGIQTILDEIDDSNLDDSILVAMGDSIWLAVDEDEDGSLENIYILDIQRRMPTWRLYNYGVNINDMIVRKTGTEYKTLLAADADNAYVLKLEDGSTDNGEAIVAELETQDLVVPNLATIFEVSIDAYYPNAPPVYEIEITDALDEIHELAMSPIATDDIAGHKAHPIVTSAVGARVKITQRSVNQNHIRAIDVGYVER